MSSIFTSIRLALAAVLLASLTAHGAEPRTCLVVGVSDGDTISARCGDPYGSGGGRGIDS